MPWGLARFQHSGQIRFVTFCCYHRSPLLITDASRRIFETALERVRLSLQSRGKSRFLTRALRVFGMTGFIFRVELPHSGQRTVEWATGRAGLLRAARKKAKDGPVPVRFVGIPFDFAQGRLSTCVRWRSRGAQNDRGLRVVPQEVL
jgi:hypothetical protein